MDENVIKILNNLNQCLSVGQSTLGGAMSVGFYDRAAQDNMKKIIISAFQERSKKIEGKLEEVSGYTGSTYEELRRQGFSLEKTIKTFKREIKSWEKISDKIASLFESIPGIGHLLSGAYRVLEWMTKLQLVSVKNFQTLTNAGVALEQSTTHLFRYASEIGISIDDLTKQMSEYSPQLAKMRGVFGNGIESFVTLEKSAKKASSELGLKLSTTLKTSMNYFDSMANSYFVQNRNIEELQTESEKYTKTLQKLAIVTGKSTESILSEIEAREKNVKWQMISSDERNKEMITAMTAMGFSQDDIISVITGMMQESTAKSMVNPGQSVLINALMEIQRSGKRLSGNEILQQAQNYYRSSGLGYYANNDYLFYKNNPHMAYSMDEDVVRGVINPINIMAMKNINSNENDIKKNKGISDLYEEWARLYNNFINMFSIEGESFNRILKGISKTLKYINDEIFTSERVELMRKWIEDFFNMGTDLVKNGVEGVKNLFNNTEGMIKKLDGVLDGVIKAFDFFKNHWISISAALLTTLGALFLGSKFLPGGKKIKGNLIGGGLAAGGVIAANDIISSVADDAVKNGYNSKATYGLSYASQGALSGAAIGTFFGGPIGAAIGAGVGAVGGGILGVFKGHLAEQEKEQKKDNKEKIDDQFSKLTNSTLNVKNEDEKKYEDEKRELLISIKNDINSIKTNIPSILIASKNIDANTNNVSQKLGNISFYREVEYQAG